jgi:uncharacterized membrane protein
VAFATPEGRILRAGIVLGVVYLAAIGVTRIWSAHLSNTLLSMTASNAIGGRAAGISLGFARHLPTWLVIAVNVLIEAILVLLFYPLFVLSYQKLIVIGPLRSAIARAQRTAEAHQTQIMKYGIPGLFLFVWLPFWMTGPMVGCVIGFLIGLRPRVNLIVVLAGTALATFCWGMLLQQVTEGLRDLGPYVPFLFVALIIFIAISVHIRHAFSRSNGNTDASDAGPCDSPPAEDEGGESREEDGTADARR